MGHDEPELRPTRVRYLVLAVACSLAVLTYVHRQGFVASQTYIKKDLQLADDQLGYLGSVWLIAYGLFQVPCGLLGDRLGARRLLTMLVFGWSLTVGAVALTARMSPGSSQALATLFVLQFLFAAFQAGVFPGIARIIADWIPTGQRGFAQGAVWTFSRLGGALIPSLIVFLITRVFGSKDNPDWATPCWLLAGVGLIWCAFFWLWFRNRPEEKSSVNAAERDLIGSGRPVTVAARGPTPWLRFLRSRNVWALCLMYGFVGFGGNFVTRLLPVYLKDHRKLDDDTTAWLTGLPLGCGVVSCVLAGVISDSIIRRTGSRKWGRRVVGGTTLALAALACLLAARSGEVWLMAVAFGSWMMFNDGMLGPAWASCADVGERYAGTLSGAMNMTGSLFGAAGIALAGHLLDKGQYTALFVAFACSYILAALCWLGVDVTKPLVPKAEGS